MVWNEIVEGLEGVGLGWIGAGVAALVVAPVVLPAVRRGTRRVVKGTFAGSLLLGRATRNWARAAAEPWQGVVTEAREEYARTPRLGRRRRDLEAKSGPREVVEITTLPEFQVEVSEVAAPPVGISLEGLEAVPVPADVEIPPRHESKSPGKKR